MARRPRRTNKNFPEGMPRVGGPRPKGKGKGKGPKGPTAKPPQKRPPTPVPPGIPRTPLTPVDPITAMYAPMFQYYHDLMAGINSRSHRDAAAAEQSARAFAEYYLQNAPGQISGVYNQAASNQSAFAKGFSQAFTQSQTELGDQANAIMGTAGAPAGQQIETGPQMGGDVAYALGGFIPSSMLGTQGAAFGAAAALQPPAIFAQGQLRAQEARDAAQKEMEPILGGIAQLQSDKAKAYFDAQQQLSEGQSAAQKNAMQLYNAGVITQAELAQLLGIPGKFPNTKKAQKGEQPIYRTIGNSLLMIDPRTGKGQVIYQAPDDPKFKVIRGTIYEYNPKTKKWIPSGGPGEEVDIDRALSADFGHLVDSSGRPIVGANGEQIPYTPYQAPARWQKGPNGSVFDPNTHMYYRNGKPYLPPESSLKNMTNVIDPDTGLPMSKSDVGQAVADIRASILDAKKKNISFERLISDFSSLYPPELWKPVVARLFGLPVMLSNKQLKKVAAQAAKVPRQSDTGLPNRRPLQQNNAFLALRRYAMILGWQPGQEQTETAQNLLNFILANRGPGKPKAAPSGGDKVFASYKVQGQDQTLADLWVQAGGDPAVANLAAAIAMGESSGNPRANLVTSAEDSRGLWQINTRAHPWARKMNLYDPLENAKAAVRVWKNRQKTFNAWSVYTSGKYKQYLGKTAGTTSTGLVAPLPGHAPAWNPYRDPEGPGGRHAALDWMAPQGTIVYAPEGGVVIEAKYDPRRSGQVYGGTVKVKTKDGRVWVFRHTNPYQVKEGMTIAAGSGIGKVAPWTGSTHSHIELWRTLRGGYTLANMLNPLNYLYSGQSV